MSEKQNTSSFRGTKRRREGKLSHSERATKEQKLFERQHQYDEHKEVLSFWVKDDNAELDYFIVEFHLRNKISLGEFRERLSKDLGDLIEENKIE